MPQFLQHFPKPFLEDVVQGRCLPFVGAGLSLNARTPHGTTMPDWDKLGREASDSLPSYQYTTALESISAYCHEFSRAKLVEFLTNSLCINSAQPGTTHEAFCRLPFERVVTTNFDFLLEQTYATLNSYCLPLIAEEQLAVSFGQAGVRLLKLHGDLHHPNRLVATEDDYDAFLHRYPLLATHLSSLLIENTALFIGYSLDDPDFRQVWQIVKERLGQLRRPAYALQVNATSHVVARYERRGVKVINLLAPQSVTYAQALETAFRELYEYWTSEVWARSTSTEAEPQAELSLPFEARGRMCFFSVPTRYAAFYKSFVYPIAEKFGFAPVMAVDVIAPGDNIMAKTSALLEKSAIVVVDASTANTVFELGMLLSQRKTDQAVVVIAEKDAPLAFDVSKYPIIFRAPLLAEPDNSLLSELSVQFQKLSQEKASAFDEEPRRLVAKHEYRAAVIAAYTVLEHELYSSLDGRVPVADLSTKFSLRQRLLEADRLELLSTDQQNAIRAFAALRNRLVHSRDEVSPDKASVAVAQIQDIVTHIRKWCLTHS